MVTAALVSSSGVVGEAATVRRMTMKRQSKSNGMHQHHTVLHPHPKHIPDSQPHHHLNRMDPLLMLHRVPLPLPTTPLLILNHNPQPLSHLRLLPRDTTILQHIQVGMGSIRGGKRRDSSAVLCVASRADTIDFHHSRDQLCELLRVNLFGSALRYDGCVLRSYCLTCSLWYIPRWLSSSRLLPLTSPCAVLWKFWSIPICRSSSQHRLSSMSRCIVRPTWSTTRTMPKMSDDIRMQPARSNIRAIRALTTRC